MNHLIVNKIGGSILKSANQLKNTAATILAKQANSIIVVSALYGVTDRLINTLKPESHNNELIDELKNTHIQWLAESPYFKNLNDSINKLQQIFHQLETHITQYKLTENQYAYAKVVSAGERLAAVIISHYFNGAAEVLFPETIELLTTNNAINSRFIKNESIHNNLDFNQSKAFIVPGFYGINKSGDYCLTGRGGSDYTAAFLASELNANELIFWKESNGIQTANPEIVPNAENVANINLHVLDQMSQAGSKILHPKVTYTLTNFSGNISFRNPLFGDQILTQIHTKKNTSGKAIIIDTSAPENNKKCTISIITRNKTAALIAIQQLKNIFNGIQILNISEYKVTFQTRIKNKSQIIKKLHDSFYLQRVLPLQREYVATQALTL